jgi:hypothetical protein
MNVRKINFQYNMNAGEICNILEEKGPKDEKTLMKLTKLDYENFNFGIGYLAREDKIKKEDDIYTLDTTNLKEHIGSVAGKVWKILEIWEESDLQTLRNLSDEEESEICKALGWLYKENKIEINEKNRYTLK